MRLRLNSEGKLAIRQLDEKFFSNHPADTTEKLRKVLEENSNNNDLYDGDFRTGTKNAS